ncbi:MAG TPA: sugar phosphate isomerase/epimerase family protein [Ktedonobacteraceae bacterium]|nr:sugar phosphate isomerase/epimerase family protein [Ktedonobacteraceae bacterium]
MKLAFSTLACPQWSIEKIVEQAAQLGYNGIELRLLNGNVIDPVKDAARVKQAVQLSRDNGVDVCALDTSCRVNYHDDGERAQTATTLLEWLHLAQEVQVPLLRVFGGANQANTNPQPTEQEVDQRVTEFLRQIGTQAEQANVTVALETHDAFASAKRVGNILNAVNSKFIGALWDSHHPYRMGESAEDVGTYLEGHIVHVHVKDAIRADADSDDWRLVLIGEGEVPVKEQLAYLSQHGYHGYVSVEWEKKWHPEIAEPEIALHEHMRWLKQLPYWEARV